LIGSSIWEELAASMKEIVHDILFKATVVLVVLLVRASVLTIYIIVPSWTLLME
jgi:hypothetical protein